MTSVAEGTESITKVDSAVAGVTPESPTAEKKTRRASSKVAGVFDISELEKEGKDLQVAPETQKLGWKLNTSPNTVEDPAVLKKFLTTPPVRKIDLHFPLGLEVTARNLKGVTIKDALDAIHKQFKKKQDDELDDPYLKGFEWDKEESWSRLIVHQQKNAGVSSSGGGGKKKKNKGETVEE